MRQATTCGLVMHILLARYRRGDGRWVQPVDKLRHHGVWLRDAPS